VRVQGLRRSPALKDRLEAGLTAMPGVYFVSGNLLTGSLLIHFDASIDLDRIINHAAALVRGHIAAPQARSTSSSPTIPAWHTSEAADLACSFDSNIATGLSIVQAKRVLSQSGRNALPDPPTRSAFEILRNQFANFPACMLAGAALVSMVTGGALEAVAILGVVAVNGLIGFGVESRSERVIHSLGNIPGRVAPVLREGRETEIPLDTIVPGDVLVLRRGAVVPADARIIAARELTVSEALLTGESMPVHKTAASLAHLATPLGERTNMVYRGTAVTGGSGLALTVATGMRTEMGHIQAIANRAGAPRTPMQRQLDDISTRVIWLALGVAAAIFGLGVFRGFGLLQMLRSSVSLAVAAVPEALPAVATTTLALGVEAMRRQDVLVRRLDAIETIASVSVICFDKTGTLTLNRMSVATVAIGTGATLARIGPNGEHAATDNAAPPSPRPADLQRLLEIGLLCSETQIEPRADGRPPALIGSATENAIVQMALDNGLDPLALRTLHPRLSLRYRTETYRFMASVHRQPGREDTLVAVKGSPEDVLALCTWHVRDNNRQALTERDRAAIRRANAAMAAEGLRVLGFAWRDDGAANPYAPVGDLVWVGLAGMADPVRPGVASLMRDLHRAGIHTVMMTGDQVATARTVARTLGFAGRHEPEVLDVTDLEHLAPAERAAAARRAHVLARVTPALKLDVIRALQHDGLVVAMIGDGINDSPALKAADVGIAMGRDSTDAAREAADIVLQTDDLATLAKAIERGRATFGNVRRTIRYLCSTNLSEVGVMMAGTAAGFPEPLSVPQLLWINLVTDVLPGLGLALEPPPSGLMQRPPHAGDEQLLRGSDFREMGRDGVMISAGALIACGWGALRYGAGPQARSMTFGSLVLSQLLHALACRPPAGNGEGRQANRALTATLLATGAAQLAALAVPGLRQALGIASLDPIDIAVTLGAGCLPYGLSRMTGVRPRGQLAPGPAP
jgi:Ca2+-transporting ATPase